MKNLESDQIDFIVNCMYPVEFAKESLIIREGDVGNSVYIIEGKLSIFFQNLKQILSLRGSC